MFFVILVSYVAAVNIAAYFLMRVDKQRAKQKEWRIVSFVRLPVVGWL
ncbi:MAG: DUF1294 domain-containing protein [Actinobacillus porcinus]|nr:DUF1294 domain-containing protein [Actinobacillus porcinus]